MTDFNALAKQIHQQNVDAGWWDSERCFYEVMQLISTEIAEATEGERKDLMDDHLPHRKMGEVELADALIRLLDAAGAYGWEYAPRDNELLRYGLFRHGFDDLSVAGSHFIMNAVLVDLSRRHVSIGCGMAHAHFSALVDAILAFGSHMNYSIMDALYEKLEYNKHRADHKRENRAKVGGKKF